MFCVRGYTLDVVCVVCMCCSRVLYTVIYIQPSWQSCTGDAAPRVVFNMHGVRVVYMYEEGVYKLQCIYGTCTSYTASMVHVQATLHLWYMYKLHCIYDTCTSYTASMVHVQATLHLQTCTSYTAPRGTCTSYTAPRGTCTSYTASMIHVQATLHLQTCTCTSYTAPRGTCTSYTAS